jgi:hypothetical protein
MVDPQGLIRGAAAIRADEVVVPDKMGDCDTTIKMARAFEKIARAHPEFKYVGVVQGRNMAEHVKCARALSFLDYIRVLALPRNMCKVHRLQRYYFAEVIPEMSDMAARWDAIHCLGASSWTREIVALTELPLIRGIDTSMPVVLGLAWLDLATTSDYTPRPIGYFKLAAVDQSQEVYIERNVRTYLEWAATPSYGQV